MDSSQSNPFDEKKTKMLSTQGPQLDIEAFRKDIQTIKRFSDPSSKRPLTAIIGEAGLMAGVLRYDIDNVRECLASEPNYDKRVAQLARLQRWINYSHCRSWI